MRDQSLAISATASLLLGVLGLSGCSANFGDVSTATTPTAMHIQGIVHGGQQPLSGARVYMYAASTVAYGGNGIAPTSGAAGNASTSLLTAATGNPADANGNFYVTTDVNGNFNINGAFACSPGQQVYLYSVDGDPQLAGIGIAGTPNPAATLLAVVGNCASSTVSAAFPNLTSFVWMNEASTVAAAYALAGFATDPLHIGAPSSVSGHSLAGIGLANAFKSALNIVNQASGAPYATLPLNSNAAVPVSMINTLADILAACINSNGVSSSGCSTLFANTTYGTAPTDTATAAINIAQHPAANVSALLNLATNASPFQSILTSANDLSLGIKYTGGGLSGAQMVAIDGSGNAWIPNFSTNSVLEFSSTGAVLSGTNGYTGGLNKPNWLAIDGSGNAWITNFNNSVVEFSSTGAVLSGANGYTGGGMNDPFQIAFDGSGNAWMLNALATSVTELSSTGAALSGANGYTGGLGVTEAIAIDGSGNAWIANTGGQTVTEFSSTGAVLSGTNGYISGQNLFLPSGVAIDGLGNAWIPNFSTNSVVELSSTGAVLSGANGYGGGGLNNPMGITLDGSGNAWIANSGNNSVVELSSTGAVLSGANGYTGGSVSRPQGIAIDGSGNVWITSTSGTSMTEIIGVGTPVITPISAGLPVVPTKDGTSNLGTRP
ncbi:NHL repeat-containing protein [Granulicella mallensis]|uniref:Sugar lactone lactonase YvrE n=1 Tax=Granulicella mallensis TaxID=940614 RepID=A0A7W7ZM00_9BACT|nr:NHL repeat-containing protein [Granulicella mallensis]MBB5062157.1 sugar lactone lactonase YvrE [Granulicella mallensis]